MVPYVLLPFNTQEAETPIPKGGGVGEVQANLEMLPPIAGISQPSYERMTPLLFLSNLSHSRKVKESKRNKNKQKRKAKRNTQELFFLLPERESAGLAFLLPKQGNPLPLYPPDLS